jgi:flagellin
VVTEGGNDSAIKTGAVSLASSQGPLTVANSNTDVFAALNINSSFQSVSALDISTVGNAQTAIATLDAALTQINSSRGALGAYQNRFESVIVNLSSTSENLTSARSRIQDADYAAETANLTKAMITQQAGISILSQANTVPQSVLALLGQ